MTFFYISHLFTKGIFLSKAAAIQLIIKIRNITMGIAMIVLLIIILSMPFL